VIRAAKSDSRLANNNLPPDVQKLRCRACYQALRFAPPVEAMGKLLADRMRSYGPYTALHLRYEKDMLTFTACLDGGLPWFHNVWYGVVWYGMAVSACTHGLSREEAEELRAIREGILWWKVKNIDPVHKRAKGYCPLTPSEVALFLSALGFTSNTPIYIAAGEIYGG
ncbi:putative 39S ribosomal protein L41-A, mitochondrial-like isoform 1, partial [Capsicum annuum]